MDDVKTKVCTKCGEEKPLDEFYKEKKAPDGHCYRCKKCAKEALKKWNEKNKEHVRQYYREYVKENEEHVKKYAAEYRKKNRETSKKYRKKYEDKQREKNKDYRKEYHRNRYEKNKKLCLARMREYSSTQTKTLHDSYIIKLLKAKGLPKEFINNNLIEAQRAIITAKRELKEHTA